MKVSYEAGKSKRNRKKLKWIIILIFMVMGVFFVFRVYGDINSQRISGVDSQGTSRIEAQRLSSEVTGQDEVSNSQDVSLILENVTRSVVGVSKLKNNGNSVFLSDGVNQMGIGSGIIISEKGYILTNEHVSGSKGSSCYVTVEDGKQYSGSVVWSDSSLDLAILKVNMKFLDFCVFGNSDSVTVGEVVYAIGNPIGFEFQKTVTSGIISAKDRTVVFKEGDEEIYLSNLIQTDATINPGNSGGPLINANGEVIGINTVKITSADGMGFAVPINCIKPILERFEKEGKFEEASIGIFAYDKNVIPYLNTRLKMDTGIYVAQISLDSSAYKSGLQIGDVIVKIDDVQLERMCDLREYIYQKRVGDRVKLTILRNNKNIELEVELVRKIY